MGFDVISSYKKQLKLNQQSIYFADLIDQAFSHLPTSLLANIVLSFILVLVLWSKVPHQILSVWILVIWTITIARAFQYRKYHSRTNCSIKSWAYQFSAGVVFTGIAWGSSGIFLFAENSLPHQVFLVFVIGGLISGATTSISAVQWVLKVFVCLLIFPITIRFFLIGGEISYAMGIMSIIYGAICIVMSSHIYKMLITSIRLKHENKGEIEERKKSEEKLMRQKFFLEGVMTNIEDGIVACDKQGALNFFNRATQIFHGVEQEQLPPEKWATHYDLYLSDGTTPMQKEDIPLFRAFNEENITDIEMVIAPKSGKKRTLLASGGPLIDDSGVKYGAFVSLHDITERKKAHEELELKVKERTKELEKALDEVKTLRGILPICSYCKNIRNDEGYYEQIEGYIHKRSGVDFSHTICPTCFKKHYPELIKEDKVSGS